MSINSPSITERIQESVIIVLAILVGVSPILGTLVFVAMYYPHEKWAWIINGICLILSGFGLETPSLKGKGVIKAVRWFISARTPLLGALILLLTYLHFGLGVIPHQVLLPMYVVLSLITAWFVEDLSYDIAGRGLFMATTVITSVAFIVFWERLT